MRFARKFHDPIIKDFGGGGESQTRVRKRYWSRDYMLIHVHAPGVGRLAEIARCPSRHLTVFHGEFIVARSRHAWFFTSRNCLKKGNSWPAQKILVFSRAGRR